jgi:hypothetical protein
VKKRGKVLRDAKTGHGLLIIEGQQFPFSVPGAWKSAQPPVPGMSVEVEFSSAEKMLAIRPISEVQIAKVEDRALRVFGRLLPSRR